MRVQRVGTEAAERAEVALERSVVAMATSSLLRQVHARVQLQQTGVGRRERALRAAMQQWQLFRRRYCGEDVIV